MSRTIASVERARNTADGNPRFDVTFTDGTTARTAPDSQVGHYAENSEWIGVPLEVRTNEAGEITGWSSLD